MNTSLIIMLICSIFLLSMVIIVPLKKKDQVSQMAGMMAAMSVGMTLGLLAGTILGVIFKGDLFLSTVLGMLAGTTVGSIAGVPFNSYAIVDGGLSGVMGGMMGAMLGEMIAPGQSESIIKIMFILFVCSQLTVLYILTEGNGKEAKGRYLRFYKNPVLMAIGVLSFFYLFNQIPSVFIINNSQTGQEIINSPHHQVGDQEIIISATDYSFDPSSLNVNLQQEVTLKLVNEGNVEHDLEIIGLNAEFITNNEVHEHQTKLNSTVHLHANAGEETKLTFKPLEIGQFSFYCTIPGHKEAGMVGSINIL
ncbi:putative cupredoxin-like copper-binding protein [Bacillus ectoiniformans]|uniref:cupredoxin domain-containing protein n=1 Tax=Bacillus ectoiniformans TaxID=1494429 RepID=UPI00195C5ABA|nr:cupredoxin domain-containing protein [Bacillus ectoiniformans]MBM7650481.1 putative cupredoxin-like copper-binding protein [Bacillus ectoiniformans]